MGASPRKGLEDENLCNAGGFPVTLIRGGAYCDSSIAFAMIRRGRVDLTILGSLQVSQKGDLANWIVPGKKVPGMGGAMELAQKAKKVIVLMNHCDKNGKPKIVQKCTLPLTSGSCVDMIITEIAVFQFFEKKLWLTEIFESFDIKDVQNKTDADFEIMTKLRTIPY
jgi:acetate CoA/acetoacetate CoA-transferase beta subunit